MWDLIVEYGMATVAWYAEFALRRRVSMSAIGSVIVMAYRPSLATVSVRTFGAVMGAFVRHPVVMSIAFPLVITRVCSHDHGEDRLPARLGDAGQFAAVCHLTEAD